MEILLIIPGFILAAIIVVIYEIKLRKSKNNVHFYVARDKSNTLWLYLGKPTKDEDYGRYLSCRRGTAITGSSRFKYFNLNPNDFKDLTFDNKPVEVFLNLKD